VIAGHFGLAAAVKSRVPAAPTWALMLATVWMDVVFTPMFFAGVETIVPFEGGKGEAYGAVVIHADWTHSLVGALLLAVSFGVVCGLPWGKKVGAVLGAVVFSHWLLDLPMHHHDLPILPGNAGHLGFGLWSFPVVAALLELVIVGVGTWLYWKKATQLSPKPARVATIAIAVSGLVTLGLNVAGI
jgi:hypothetical protein